MTNYYKMHMTWLIQNGLIRAIKTIDAQTPARLPDPARERIFKAFFKNFNNKEFALHTILSAKQVHSKYL